MSTGKALENWGKTQKTVPAVLVNARSVEDVVEAVRNPANPTPVLAVGSMHSVTECLVNDGGTIINVSGGSGDCGGRCSKSVVWGHSAVTAHSVAGTPATHDHAWSCSLSAGLNNVLGVEGGVVRLQTGVKLADLHDWLAEKVRARPRRQAVEAAPVLIPAPAVPAPRAPPHTRAHSPHLNCRTWRCPSRQRSGMQLWAAWW